MAQTVSCWSKGFGLGGFFCSGLLQDQVSCPESVSKNAFKAQALGLDGFRPSGFGLCASGISGKAASNKILAPVEKGYRDSARNTKKTESMAIPALTRVYIRLIRRRRTTPGPCRNQRSPTERGPSSGILWKRIGFLMSDWAKHQIMLSV